MFNNQFFCQLFTMEEFQLQLFVHESQFGCTFSHTPFQFSVQRVQIFLCAFTRADVAVIDDNRLDAGFMQQVGNHSFSPTPGAILMTQPENALFASAWLLNQLRKLLTGPIAIFRVHELEDILTEKFILYITQSAASGWAFPQ